MAVVFIDGTTIRSFINDELQFSKSIREAFASLDVDRDGVLSRSELRRGMEALRLLEKDFGVDVESSAEEVEALHDAIFEMFDRDKSGGVDVKEFGDEMKNLLAAVADGLGRCPVQMALEGGDDSFSFLKQAADLEAAKAQESS
ncbi:hypothetical protein M569_06344, partial [Genlisea aurea]